MPRRRRLIRSKRTFELELRVKEGIAFPTLLTMNLIIESAMARAQRDDKIEICDYVWMGNHVHMLFVSRDAQACVNFYQEVQKKICESMKRLLGLPRLNIWEGDPVLMEILDVEAVIERKAYLYANPARADLVDKISDYLGVTTWDAFLSSMSVDTEISRLVPWIQLPTIRKLPSRKLSEVQDLHFARGLRLAAKNQHVLKVRPNGWMNVFGIKDENEVAEINQRIKERIAEKEEAARQVRKEKGKTVIGKWALARQAILMPHTPKKRERRIFVYSSIKELRIAYIKAHNEICEVCVECYRRWRFGDCSTPWPPGTFCPALGVFASALVIDY